MLNRILLVSTFGLIPVIAFGQTVFIDFGDTPTTGQPDTWNNINNPSNNYVGSLIGNLLDSTGATTGIGLSVTNGFNGVNRDGVDTGSPPVPTTASRDSFYTANSNWSSSPGDGMGVFEFSGLDPSKTYDFTMFASRMGTSENRQALYTVQGANSDTALLNPSGNVANTVSIVGITPTAGGIITLTVEDGPANVNANDFAYIGSLEISIIPEPGTTALITGFMVSGLLLIRRRIS